MSILSDIKHVARSVGRAVGSRPSLMQKRYAQTALAQRMFERGRHFEKGRKARNEYYPGAETGRFRADWLSNICTSTSLLRSSLKVLSSRSEYAYRTDPYARRAVDILSTFVVGSGIRPFPSVKLANGEPVEGINKQLSAAWDRINDEGMRVGSQPVSIYEAQRIEFVTMCLTGSYLSHIIKARPGSLLPYAFDILKGYRLDFSKDTYIENISSELVNSGNFTLLGQVMNQYKEPQAFYIEGISKPISAENMSLHFRPIEAEQYLGVPWLTPSLGNIWDTQQLIEDKLAQSRTLTRMGVFIKEQSVKAFDDISETDENGEESMPFDRNQVYFGKEKPEPIQFDDKISDSLVPLLKVQLHGLAVGCGFSYQLLSSDLEDANFSSGHLNAIIDSKVFSQLFKHFYKDSCQSKWNKIVEWLFLTDQIKGATYAQYASDPWRYSQCYWLPEGTEWNDPVKGATARRLAYQTGQMTLQEMCAMDGKDYKSIIAQRKKEKEELKDAGLEELLPSYTDSLTEIEATKLAKESNTDAPI